MNVTDESYMFLRVTDRSKLAEAPGRLAALNEVIRWDAIDGYYQAALLCKGDASQCRAEVHKLDSAAEIVECRVLAESSVGQFNDDKCHSYLLIETDPQKHADVNETLKKFENVISCTDTDGLYKLVAIVEDDTFDLIDRLVSEQIATIDGILRMKQDRIILRNSRSTNPQD